MIRVSSSAVLGVSGFVPGCGFDELALTSFLLIQAFTERHYPLFSIVIPVVVGSNPISHPKINDLEGTKSAAF